ncbi:fatty acid desaturase family protein [Amnibacterium setariae]|uniref:Acyl-CoA desaturase n=1 Tax=Amnibacterium setariae TaxID=2306585 RepID=A0A3A1TTY1_9MICO|nr:acyl-CoA desaturase [Amnibacterium setariae]RIX26404.1 acyl-CoA desaturase [Amnibacterium setariae]
MSVAVPSIRSTEPRTTRSGGAQAAHAQDYAVLIGQVKESGLLDRRPGSYALRGIVLAALFAVGLALLLTLGRTWWQLLVAAYFAVLCTQVAFLAHDSAHKQIFSSGPRGELVSRVLADLVVGLSYGWWMNKHTRHHANPNTLGRDGDILPGAIVFVPDAEARPSGLRRRLTARQGYFYLPILALAGADLHLSAVNAVLGGEKHPHRLQEGVMIAIRLIGFAALLVLVLGPLLGTVFLLVQVALFGVYMGGTFSLNHTGMRIIGRDEKVDYLRRQVLTSRNISGGLPMEHVMGGLNLQIEHHLFPSMPSANLRRVRPLVRAHCARLGIAYEENRFGTAWGIVLRHIHQVGVRHADPFDCPAARTLRTA